MSVAYDVQFDRGRKPGRPPVTNPAQLGVTGQAPLRQIIRQLRRGASSNLILRLSIVHCSISFLTQGSCSPSRYFRAKEIVELLAYFWYVYVQDQEMGVSFTFIFV
jgi:hypothetical protein